MYTNLFDGKEDTVNWTSELITDFDSQYKKGEYDVVKFEGMKIKMPTGYTLDKKTEYTYIYKKNEEESIILSKPFDDTDFDMDLFGEDFGEGRLTEKQKEKLKEDFVKYFGFYSQNMYEWNKLMGIVTLDDVDIFNPRKTALLSTALIMKSVAGIPNSEYYLYENGELYANINIHTVQNKEKGDREIVNVHFGTPDLEYSIALVQPDQDNDITIEEIVKILNSINLD